MNIQRGKMICKLYKDGFTLTQISKQLDINHSQVESYLRNYYEKIYDEKYRKFSEKRNERLNELYEQYKEVYVQGAFTRTEICKKLNCDVQELEGMIRKFKLKNQWLRTYQGQQTLCNTSREFRESVKQFAKENGYRSVRAVVVEAVNEFMMMYNFKNNEEN